MVILQDNGSKVILIKRFVNFFADNNGFVKGMREFKQCVERDQIIFNVQES